MKICAGSFPAMGLSNRLRALLSVMRVSERHAVPYCLYWPVTKEVPCRFHDLFQMPVEQVDEPKGDAFYFSWRLWVSQEELPEGWARAYPSDDVKGRAIDLEYARIPEALRDAYSRLAIALSPAAELVRRAEAICDRPFVSVHIRDGAEWEEWGRTIPLQNFFDVMDRYPADTRFFIAAQLTSTVERVAERYPGRVFHQAKDDRQEATVRRMQDSLVDMLCLARGTELIATFGSTFSEMAWWLGRCTQKVSVVEGDKSRFRYF